MVRLIAVSTPLRNAKPRFQELADIARRARIAWGATPPFRFVLQLIDVPRNSVDARRCVAFSLLYEAKPRRIPS
jgi:hypothetical protein